MAFSRYFQYGIIKKNIKPLSVLGFLREKFSTLELTH